MLVRGEDDADTILLDCKAIEWRRWYLQETEWTRNTKKVLTLLSPKSVTQSYENIHDFVGLVRVYYNKIARPDQR